MRFVSLNWCKHDGARNSIFKMSVCQVKWEKHKINSIEIYSASNSDTRNTNVVFVILLAKFINIILSRNMCTRQLIKWITRLLRLPRTEPNSTNEKSKWYNLFLILLFEEVRFVVALTSFERKSSSKTFIKRNEITMNL